MSKLGVELHDNFVWFRVWAPFARSVAVKGDFSNWQEIPLAKSNKESEAGVWSVQVKNAKPGQSYLYDIVGYDGQSLAKNDPRARALTDGDNSRSVIVDDDFDWGGDDQFVAPSIESQVLYELHVGTFARPDAATTATFAGAITKLDYLKDLGITTIELMPITSMATSFGWGYEPGALYSVDNVYGGMFGLKNFIKEAHRRGLAVILDLVYNHFMKTDLWRFDGWYANDGDGIYFYNDVRGHTPWGERPDYGRAEVRDFILDNVAMWLSDYHVDGMRLDSTIYLRNINGRNNDPSGDIPEAWQLLGQINKLAHDIKPRALMIAEDCSGNNWITKPATDQGCAFDSQWDLGLPHVIRGALGVNNEMPGLDHLVDVMSQKFNDDWRQRVVFADSHDTAANGGARLISAAERDPHDVDARHIAILSSAVALTTPGIPMLLAGSEFLQGGDFNDWNALDWQNLQQFSGVVKAHQHLIALRRNQYGDSGGLMSGELKILDQNESDKVLIYQRGQDNNQPVVVVASFNEQRINNYHLALPAGHWRVRFNSSWKGYSADFAELKIDFADQSTVVTLTPHVVLILTLAN